MSNLDKYNEIFSSLFNSNSLEELKYGNSSWDSAGHLILITELENAFDIRFSLEDILSFRSYLYGIELLKKYDIELK